MSPSMRAAAVGLAAVTLAGVGAAAAPVATGAPGKPELRILAVGDSYASGLGAGGLSPQRSAWGTDCGRATGETSSGAAGRAYPVVARDALEKAGIPVSLSFVACTGRTTNNWAHQVAEAYRQQGIDIPLPEEQEAVPLRTSPTVRAIDAQTAKGNRWDVVTVTFGGNNLQVLGFLSGCMDATTPDGDARWTSGGWGGCDVGEEAVQKQVDLLVGRRPVTDTDAMVQGRVPFWSAEPTEGDVAPLFEALAHLVRPGGRVVVVGYPQMFAPPEKTVVSTGWPSGGATLEKIGLCQGVGYADVRTIRKGIDGIDTKFQQSVAAADAAWQGRGVRFEYVDATKDVYEKGGQTHGLCSADPWIHGIGTDKIGPLHPTQGGQTAMGEVVAQRIEAAVTGR